MESERKKALRFLSGLRGKEKSLGRLVSALRMFEGLSQAELARKLGLRRGVVCDLEADRRVLMPAQASQIAKALGYDEEVIIGFAVEDWLAREGLAFEVALSALPPSAPSGRRPRRRRRRR